ncbi:MAG: hypothetical protein M3315_14600, partial [Actinomycetota bacterium]|nr:hypothetical protein [Actinomycetota bacterium]
VCLMTRLLPQEIIKVNAGFATRVDSKERGHRMLARDKRTEGYYEVQEVPFGTVYRWRPRHLAECECSERLSLTAYSTATCPQCGANHGATAREELTVERLEDQTLHPWRYSTTDFEDAGLPC